MASDKVLGAHMEATYIYGADDTTGERRLLKTTPEGYLDVEVPNTVGVDIVAQSVGNLDVNIAEQTLGEVNANITNGPGDPASVQVENFPATQNVDITAQSVGNLDVNIAAQDAALQVEDLEVSNTSTETSPTITTASTTILAANANRKGAVISNPPGGATVYVSFGSTATTSKHPLVAGGRLTVGRMTASIAGIVASGTQALAVSEFT